MKFYSIIFALIALPIISCNKQVEQNNNSAQEWKLIYRTDNEGKSIFGNKDELLAIARKGNPIRVGWASRRKNDTTKSVEHMVNGGFLTIANGKELFVQIDPFFAQRPDLTGDTLSMNLLPTKLHWILGTNGTISSVNINFAKDTTTAQPPKPFRHGLSWYAKVSTDLPANEPLWQTPTNE